MFEACLSETGLGDVPLVVTVAICQSERCDRLSRCKDLATLGKVNTAQKRKDSSRLYHIAEDDFGTTLRPKRKPRSTVKQFLKMYSVCHGPCSTFSN